MKYLTPLSVTFYLNETSDQNKISLPDLLKEPLEHMIAVRRNVLSTNLLQEKKMECMCCFSKLSKYLICRNHNATLFICSNIYKTVRGFKPVKLAVIPACFCPVDWRSRTQTRRWTPSPSAYNESFEFYEFKWSSCTGKYFTIYASTDRVSCLASQSMTVTHNIR